MKINKIRFFLHFYVLYGINKKNSFKFNTKWQTNFTHERIIIHFSTNLKTKGLFRCVVTAVKNFSFVHGI